MNRCGASKEESPEYGKPKGVKIKIATEIKKRPVNKLKILSALFTNNINGEAKAKRRLNKRLTIIAIKNSAWLPAPDLPIIGINKYKAPMIR